MTTPNRNSIFTSAKNNRETQAIAKPGSIVYATDNITTNCYVLLEQAGECWKALLTHQFPDLAGPDDLMVDDQDFGMVVCLWSLAELPAEKIRVSRETLDEKTLTEVIRCASDFFEGKPVRTQLPRGTFLEAGPVEAFHRQLNWTHHRMMEVLYGERTVLNGRLSVAMWDISLEESELMYIESPEEEEDDGVHLSSRSIHPSILSNTSLLSSGVVLCANDQEADPSNFEDAQTVRVSGQPSETEVRAGLEKKDEAIYLHLWSLNSPFDGPFEIPEVQPEPLYLTWTEENINGQTWWKTTILLPSELARSDRYVLNGEDASLVLEFVD